MAICWSDRDQGPFFQNGKLLAERDGVKRRSEELALEKDILKVAPLPSALTISYLPEARF